jgi:hypothetical protein
MQSSIQRAPIPALKPFIRLVWASSHQTLYEGPALTERERMIPSACMHLVFRFADQPIRIFKSIEDIQGDAFYRGVVAGIHSGYYVKDIAPDACTVGALLQPAACEALFGIPADEVSGRHVALGDLWGSEAGYLSERLQETSDFERRLQIFESFMAKRLPRVSGIHPAIVHALSRFPRRTTLERLSARRALVIGTLSSFSDRALGFPLAFTHAYSDFKRPCSMASTKREVAGSMLPLRPATPIKLTLTGNFAN